MRKTTVLAALALLCTSSSLAARRTSEVWVDLGTEGFPTNGAVAEAWNDVDPTNMATPFELVDATGAATGITWALTGTMFTGANSAGTSSPQPGSLLAEFPVSATRDVMYGQNGATVVIELSGFASNQLVDLTFAASRTGVSDMRTTDYLVQGFNGEVATLDPSNNTSMTVAVGPILPDSNGKVTISVRAASTNTNQGTHYFYLGGVRLDLTATTGTPQVLGIDTPSLDATLKQGTGTYATSFTVSDSTGGSPAVSLSAVDDATGLAPVWLSLPSSAAVGVPVPVTFDESPLPIGDYSATVTATAAGYPDARLVANLSVRDPATLNLLFYGNSYSLGNYGMPSLAGYIAEEAGHPSPHVVEKLVGGQNLFFHLTDPDQSAAITEALTPGEQWDYVVMQGFSLEATEQYGDPAAFRANALAILTNVKAHSPNAKAVMFQTWARGPAFGGYPSTYSGPLAMHAEIRANYQLAVADMNAAFGPGTAYDAAIGDAVALLAFDPSLYMSDQSHPTQPTSLMAGMGVYQAIWRERVCDVKPDFDGGSNLINRLNLLGLDQSDWIHYGGIAERIADAELRRYPGSGEDLLLVTGVNGTRNACPQKDAGSGNTVSATLSSPNGLYTGMASFLVLDPFPTGNMPGTSDPYPELHFHLPSSFLVKQTSGLAGPLTWQSTVPDSFPGLSLLLQAVTFGASATTGNSVFSTTDAHEIVLH